MQRYRHYGASTPSATSLAAPAEEPHSTQEALNAHEQVCEEQAEPIVSEEAQDGLKKTGGDILEEAAATQQAPLFSEAKPPESKSSKKAAGGDVGAGAKYSVFTWFAVLALLGVWSSVAVVYFDIVDYDSVVGKLTAYDTDGDGDFDVEDAKVLLGLKETPSQGQPTEEGSETAGEQLSNRQATEAPEEPSVEVPTEETATEDSTAEDQSTDREAAEPHGEESVEMSTEETATEDSTAEDQSTEPQAAEPHGEESVEVPVVETATEDLTAEDQSTEREAAEPHGEESVEVPTEETTTDDSPTISEAEDVDSEIQAPVPLPAFVEEDFVADDPREDLEHPYEEDVDAIDTSGVLVEEPSSQETVVESANDLTSSKLTQEEPPVEVEQWSEPVVAQDENVAESISAPEAEPAEDVTSSKVTHEEEPPLEAEKQSEPDEAPSETTRESNTPEETADHPAAEKPKEKGKKKKPKLLNKLDKTIKAELDAAEKLRKKGKAEAALEAFETLIQQHPQSPRAHYGKAQAEDDLAEKQRSNDMLQKAIGSYRDAAELPDATPDLVRAALKRRAERQQFLGRMRGAVATLERLGQIFPEDISLKNDLGVAYLLLGDNQSAKTVYEEVLALAPSDGFAKVHYGFILKSENKIAESIPYLKEGLESEEPGTDDGRFYFHLGDALQRVGDKSAYHWYQLGHERGHFASVWQRSLYNVDGLKAQPWWTPNETGYTDLVKALEKNWKMIRDEAMVMMDQKTGQFVPEEENLREKGEWGQYTLWQQGKKSGTSCQAVPKTCSLLERFPEAIGCKRGQIKFSVMQPGTHVWPHTGPTNCRLRMHLGLVIPKQGCRIRCTDQTREWEEGKVLIFDDSFEHEVWQDADTFRLIFIVDVWHPQLTAYQRQTLSAI
ncbi:aspartyl/asparaginyl beta-hydroxylase isoform X3 [Hippocampus comes]|uniref:aspartyl/asparaginyl beta-hydroxylase isoform X3 n=1 Tax=Hippocampus comes TaxID=109280 RepID=UPI00094ECB6D|nr:PREDICTED: aspartyl/asparaginyl beta-hydroxylase isoform X3 [Hippocampus comes]